MGIFQVMVKVGNISSKSKLYEYHVTEGEAENIAEQIEGFIYVTH